jgi:hypothetical protein
MNFCCPRFMKRTAPVYVVRELRQMTTQIGILEQIDTFLDAYKVLQSRSRFDDCSDQPEQEITALLTSMCDCIKRFAPVGSQYIESMSSILTFTKAKGYLAVHRIAGVLKALRTAYEKGYLTSLTDLIRADIFADFIEMADYLLSEGYKDPSAVVVGSVLEEHLRQLCTKNGIATNIAGKAKKAEQLNSELAGQAIYSKLDQKSETSWLDLRNKAAHGKYNEYTKEQVKLLLEGIRNFMVRVPA